MAKWVVMRLRLEGQALCEPGGVTQASGALEHRVTQGCLVRVAHHGARRVSE